MADNSLAYLVGRLVFDIDRTADHLLQTHLSISYKRFLFLTVLQHTGTVTQHELAVALGYSDPAVSMMLVELAKDGHLQITPSPEHGRKRLVALTATGGAIVAQGRQLLDAHFDQLTALANVDPQHLREIVERLHQALNAKTNKE